MKLINIIENNNDAEETSFIRYDLMKQLKKHKFEVNRYLEDNEKRNKGTVVKEIRGRIKGYPITINIQGPNYIRLHINLHNEVREIDLTKGTIKHVVELIDHIISSKKTINDKLRDIESQ